MVCNFICDIVREGLKKRPIPLVVAVSGPFNVDFHSGSAEYIQARRKD